MCWSGEASAALAVAGFAGSAYFYKKGESKELCASLAYFSAMEALQAVTYSVIDQCGSPANQTATVLGYVHISFQPFFINAMSMQFIPEHVRKKIQWWIYGACLITTIFFLLRLYPFSWAQPCWTMKYTIPFCGTCHPSVPFCGPQTCSVSGDWHIAWQIPAYFVYAFDNAYLFAAFILPIVYGSWKLTVYLIASGPLLAALTTSNANEWAAVWCLYSIGLLGLLIKSPIRNYLHVKRWPLWKLIGLSSG